MNWDLSNIYNFKDTDKLIKELTTLSTDFEKQRDSLSEDLSSEDFLNLIKQKEKMATISAKLSSYANLWLSENTADPQRNAHLAKLDEQLTDIGNKTLFFALWFKSISETAAKKFIEVAGEYSYMLVRIRDFKDNTLEEKEEQIINLKDLSGTDLLTRMYDLVTNQFTFEWEGKQVQKQK